MRTVVKEGETRVADIDASRNWSVRMKLPRPINEPFGINYLKLVVEAVQFAASTDASGETEKKFDARQF